MLASVIITNHNYERFLAEAIDSALAQTYPRVEVIVVDDGSTDRSAEVIEEYGDRVTALFQENGGQTSAINVGFGASSGDVVCFLDADDTLLPSALGTTVNLFRDPNVVKVHWPLWEVNALSQRTGSKWPERDLPDGDYREQAARMGPDTGSSPPTSGNVWSRRFLQDVLPLAEIEREMQVGSASADDILSFLAALAGITRSISEPQGTYRIHGRNEYASQSFEQRVWRSRRVVDHLCNFADDYCRRRSIDVDVGSWKQNSWFHGLARAVDAIIATIPIGSTLILIDCAQWGIGNSLGDRRVVPFLERDGQYWGPPPDDLTAIRELERLRLAGAQYLVFGWPAFWWLDEYVAFRQYVRSHFASVLEDEKVLVLDLGSDHIGGRTNL